MDVSSGNSCRWRWTGGSSNCDWSVSGTTLTIVNKGDVPVPSLAKATLYGVQVIAGVASSAVPPECKIVGSSGVDITDAHTNTVPITITGESRRSVTWSGEAVTTFYYQGAKGDFHMTFAYSDHLDAHSVLTVNMNGLNLGSDLKCRVR